MRRIISAAALSAVTFGFAVYVKAQAPSELRAFAQQESGSELGKGQTVILGTYPWDIETNVQSGKARIDLFWQQVQRATSTTPQVQNLVPQAGAGLALVADIPFEKLSADDLRKLAYRPEKLPNTSLKPGTVFAVRTSEGNFAKLTVIGYRDSHDFSFEDAKYITPDQKTYVLSRPKIADRHLEVSWVLFQK